MTDFDYEVRQVSVSALMTPKLHPETAFPPRNRPHPASRPECAGIWNLFQANLGCRSNLLIV